MTVNELIASLSEIAKMGGGDYFVGIAYEYSPTGSIPLQEEEVEVVEAEDEALVVVLGSV